MNQSLKAISSFIFIYRIHGYLWLALLVPSFLSFGKIHFVYSVLFLWALICPQNLPILSLICGGAVQDILLKYPLGSHSLVYGFFLLGVISQKPYIHKRSFILRWTAFGLFLLICEGGRIFCLQKTHNLLEVMEGLFYTVLIPWVSFPLIVEPLQKALGSYGWHHGQ
jgi:cell shape-determining protein MreD